MLQGAAHPGAVLDLHRGELEAQDPSLYGRFDFSYDGQGPAKLLEYNADTPTSVFETGVFQWMWLEDAIARNTVPKDADQYNSLHEQLIAGWREIGEGRRTCISPARSPIRKTAARSPIWRTPRGRPD